jgi:hypothetical protein
MAITDLFEFDDDDDMPDDGAGSNIGFAVNVTGRPMEKELAARMDTLPRGATVDASGLDMIIMSLSDENEHLAALAATFRNPANIARLLTRAETNMAQIEALVESHRTRAKDAADLIANAIMKRPTATKLFALGAPSRAVCAITAIREMMGE